MVMGNRVEFLELVTGALWAGAWMTPVNWHLTADEISFILGDSGAKVLFVDPVFETVARDAVDRAGLSLPVVLAGPELEDQLAESRTDRFDPDGPAGGNMFYTSGTTGRPKGVKRAG